MNAAQIATMISLGHFNRKRPASITGEIKLTPEQTKMIQDALNEGKKVTISIEI